MAWGSRPLQPVAAMLAEEDEDEDEVFQEKDCSQGLGRRRQSPWLTRRAHVALSCACACLLLGSLAVLLRPGRQPSAEDASAHMPGSLLALAAAKGGGNGKRSKHKEAHTRLFCFSVSMTMGYEVSLVAAQYRANVSIFSCDSWAVYSIDSFQLGPGVNTTAIPGPPAVWKQDQHAVFNTEVFIRAWEKIREAKLHKKVDWVVKVDVDAVFFPSRLRKELGQDAWSWVTQWGGAAFVKNCAEWNSMQGPLEILSRGAVQQLLDGLGECQAGRDVGSLGEDQFLDQCLEQLGLAGVGAFDVLSDFYCSGMPAACDCENAVNRQSSAFHPCKSEKSYFKCQKAALESDTSSSVAVK